MRRFSFLVVLVSVSAANAALAAPGDLVRSIPNPVPSNYAGFGWAVAGASDSILVGAPNHITGVWQTGSAYVFDASGNLKLSLQNPVGDANDGFGYSVAVGNGNLLVGAPRAHIGGASTGAAYLFGPNGAPLRTFAKPTPTVDDLFGFSVAMNATKVLVGAPVDDVAAGDGGAVYLFDTANGNLLHTFTSPAQTPIENFGASVAWVGDKVLVGASQESLEPWHSVGAAYLFNQSGDLLQSFHSPNSGIGEYFGTSVAGIGNNIFVGAPGWKNYRSTTTAGSVYLFNGSTGELTHTFVDPAANIGDLFGVSMAIVGTDHILIGAAYDNTSDQGAGAAYLFDSTRSLCHTYYEPMLAAESRFGYAMAAVGNHVIIGAPGNNTAVGVAYQFQAVPEPSTLALLGIGAIGLLAYGWRRRRG